ncbi:MAG TPA: pyridoxal-dependent decarboxylase [Acidobacteriota bacterium]|nr:pyridoxal-dependent decarboxylase [Acidobacteriota bacterium]
MGEPQNDPIGLEGAEERTERLLREVLQRAIRYLDSLGERPVSPSPQALQNLGHLEEAFPERGRDALETLGLLDEYGAPATMATAGSRYFGFVNGAVLPAALAASWMSSVWDQNAGLPVMSPVADRLHEVVRGWLLDLLGLPEAGELCLVSGASMANTTALIAARDRLLAQAGWDVQAHGLFGAPPLQVVVGERVHSTLLKSLGMAGLGRQRVITVPADEQGRMRADALPDLEGPVLVCAQAGEVNTGAFDPFAEIISWARRRQAWVHVDGAFGLWALADPGMAHLVEGLRQADSWVTDGHKLLNLTYDCGILLVRRGEDLRRSFAATAAYLPPDRGFEALHHGPQGSQRARQIEVWAALRTLGRSGVKALVRRQCGSAQRLAEGLAEAGLEVLNEVVFNQVLVRACKDDQLTRRLIAAVQEDATCWCGPTDWDGRPAMRISVSSWRTDQKAAQRSLAAILRCARRTGAIAS